MIGVMGSSKTKQARVDLLNPWPARMNESPYTIYDQDLSFLSILLFSKAMVFHKQIEEACIWTLLQKGDRETKKLVVIGFHEV